MESPREFTYWKRAWAKWLLPAAAVLELIAVILCRKELLNLEAIGPRIYTPQALAVTLAAQKMSLLLSSMLLLAIVWIFLTGLLVRRKQTARLSELLLVLTLTVLFAVGLYSWYALLPTKWFWLLTLLILTALSVCLFVIWLRSRSVKA